MKTHEPQLKIRAALECGPDQVAGRHLEDEELVAYALDHLPEYKVVWLDRHLESCDECASKVEQLQASAERCRSPGGRQVMGELQQRLFPPSLLSEPVKESGGALAALANLIFNALGARAADQSLHKSKCFLEGHELVLHSVRETDGSLSISISSPDLGLAGRTLTLIVEGEEQGRDNFRKLGRDRVTTYFEIPHSVRKNWPDVPTVECKWG